MLRNAKHIDALIQQLLNAIPPGLHTLRNDMEKNFRAIIQHAFDKLDLVTREEFEAQIGVLRRSREKLDHLEKQLSLLQSESKELP